jgi:DNA polymerase III delta prime subunit
MLYINIMVDKKKNKNPEELYPNVILALPNLDKEFNEEWVEKRNMLNFPHSYRALFAGVPNSGKSTFIKNIIIRANPEFSRIIIVHGDKEDTLEYNDIDCEMREDIPTLEEYDGTLKTLLVIDDIDFTCLSKDELKNLERTFGYISSHKNVSICITSQDVFRLPKFVRRYCNIFVIWKILDKDNVAILNRRLGLQKDVLFNLFQKHLHKPTDSLLFDYTKNTPYPIRLNGFKCISIDDV